jgi:drug/metabolite transporter (DMT)-like permease
MSRLWVFAAALLFSTGGAAIKGNTLTSWQVASFRSLIAAAALALLIPSARRNWNRRHLIVGAAYAATLILFVTATRMTTAANAIFLQSTAPAYLIVLGPVLLREHLRRSDMWLLLGVAIGMALFFVAAEPPRATAPDPVSGNVVGVFSGVGWAFTVVGLRWVGRADDGVHAGMATVVAGNCLAGLAALPFALPVESVSAKDLLVLLYLGVFQIGLAYVCLTRAIRRISAFEASTLLLIEPALNPVWTWLILGERPAALSIAGGSIILASTLLSTWWATRVRPSGAV